MGRLRPDILVMEGSRVRAVIDAKYKRLHNSRERRDGVDQSDLYQLASYSLRFRPSAYSALLYPLDPGDAAIGSSTAEAHGPWRSEEQRFIFRRLPNTPDACREALGRLLDEDTSAVMPAASAMGQRSLRDVRAA